MTRGANFWIGITLLVFSVALLPSAIPPEDPNQGLRDLAERSLRSEAGEKTPTKVDVERRYEGFMAEQRFVWLRNLVLLTLSVVGVVLTLLQRKLGLWIVLLLCVLMLMVYLPPMLPDLLNGRFIRTISLVHSTVFRAHGFLNGAVLFWHIVVAPFAYLLLAITTIIVLRNRSLKRGAT
jgi:hypothetical protein